MSLLTCYIDTNIFIEYIFRTHITENAKRNTACCKLIDKGVEGLFNIYISDYTLMEISQHLTDYYLMLKVIKDGFSFREFSRTRKDYTLDDEEAIFIAKIVEGLRTSEYLTYVETEEITGDFYKIVMGYVKEYIDFLDALHLRTAIDVECDYFLTKDVELRKRAQALITKKIITEPIKMSTPPSFLRILKK